MINWVVWLFVSILFFWIIRKIFEYLKKRFFTKSKTVKMRVNRKEVMARRKRMLIALPILILLLAFFSFWIYQWFLVDYFKGTAISINDFEYYLATERRIDKLVTLGNTWSIEWENGAVNKVNVLYNGNQQILFLNSLSRSGSEVVIKMPLTAGIILSFFMLSFFVIFFLVIVFWWPKIMGGGLIKTSFKEMGGEWSKTKFSDVAAIDEAKEELWGIIEFLRKPKDFTSLGAVMPKGVLLQGPPGCGKTLLARALAGEAEVPFFPMSGSEFVEMYVGVGASRIRNLFSRAKANAPCIVFIDEIDAFGRQRSSLPTAVSPREEEGTLNELLTQMDGFDQISGILVLAATNRPDILDSALLRPGRFDSKINISPPGLKGRVEILKVHVRGKPLANDVNLELIAGETPGLTGAELANIVNEAAIHAAEEKRTEIRQKDFGFAIDKVTLGEMRKSLVLSKSEKEACAYHEAGHALVAYFLPATDPVQKVSVIPRYRFLGITKFLPVEEHYILTKERALSLLALLLGGRMAESIALNLLSAGASHDIGRATVLAREMVCRYGMSKKLGLRTIREEDFLFAVSGQGKNFSEITAKTIDEEIDSLIKEAAGRAEKILRENMVHLENIKKVLMEKEEIDGDEFLRIISGGAANG